MQPWFRTLTFSTLTFLLLSTAGCTPPQTAPSITDPSPSPSSAESTDAAQPEASASSSSASSPSASASSDPASPIAHGGPVQLQPTPQQVSWDHPSVSLTGAVSVINLGADQQTLDAVEALVTAAGGTIVADDANPAVRIIIGVGAKAQAYLPADFAVPEHAEGYALTTLSDDVAEVVAVGSDVQGAFYATETLKQLTIDGIVRGAAITDWPLMKVRGVVEGFYGTPWSHQTRLDLIKFFGANKLNSYIYTPKDDPYLRANWREAYPAEELNKLRELVDAARSQHVEFIAALSPGQDICYTSESDFNTTIAKFDQLRQVGVTSFYVALDDIPQEATCDEDRAFGNSPEALTEAQSAYLNRIQNQYLAPHGLAPLTMVPTEYTGVETTSVKKTQADTLDPQIRVQWTGLGIVADTITVDQAKKAASAYGTEHLVIWDNYPVNDGEQTGQIFLSPVPGRATDLYTVVDGLTSNPMIQAYASMPSLASMAAYTWNPVSYDPQITQTAALQAIAGTDSGLRWDTMQAFADLNLSWPFSAELPASPGLTADIDSFETALASDDDAAIEQAASSLQARLDLLAAAPENLKEIKVEGFYQDCLPWITAAADWAEAGKAAIALHLAVRRGDDVAAADAYEQMLAAAETARTPRVELMGTEDLITPVLGDGQFERLIEGAQATWQG